MPNGEAIDNAMHRRDLMMDELAHEVGVLRSLNVLLINALKTSRTCIDTIDNVETKGIVKSMDEIIEEAEKLL